MVRYKAGYLASYRAKHPARRPTGHLMGYLVVGECFVVCFEKSMICKFFKIQILFLIQKLFHFLLKFGYKWAKNQYIFVAQPITDPLEIMRSNSLSKFGCK